MDQQKMQRDSCMLPIIFLSLTFHPLLAAQRAFGRE